MWITAQDAEGPAWIQYEFDRILKLHEMLVWNHNGPMESVLGLGGKDVTIEYSVDGIDFTTLGTTHEFTQAPGLAGYAANTTIDFSGAAAKYVKLTINSNWKGILEQYGLSEVRFFYIRARATEPSPESGATNVDLDLTLSWRAGIDAAVHDVYISTDEQFVMDAAREEIWIEAEATTTIEAPMMIFDDPTASGGQYLMKDPAAGESTGSPPADGLVTYTFTVAGGTYKIAGRVISSGSNDSFWVRIPTATTQTTNHSSGWVRWNGMTHEGEWGWHDIWSSEDDAPYVEFTMAAGEHTLEIRYREDETQLDALVISNVAVNTVTEPSYSGSFDLGSTYYWRVDEVNDAEIPTTWQSEIWNFSTPEFLIVDDFESYTSFNDLDPGDPESNWIFDTWIDEWGRWGNAMNGAFVGDPQPAAFVAHSGRQLMQFSYDNTGPAEYSEAERMFAVPQDWTKYGIKVLALHLGSNNLSEALDTTFSLTTEGDADWLSQGAISYHDGDAAQSGDISDNQDSLMQTTVSGEGTASFYWKVSSEADWDFLEFYIDGELQDEISGETDWQQMTYAITGSGSHTLQWRYFKDGAVTGGEDVGWVDKFEWTGAGQPAVMPGNTGQLYAKVNGVKVNYPGSVAAARWMKWDIDLASLGVNLQAVTTLAVGIDGNGASGTLYFDDFRLEP
jgi:hypothetical protein